MKYFFMAYLIESNNKLIMKPLIFDDEYANLDDISKS